MQKKIVTVCARGNSRSVALAFIFKDVLGHDAVAIGIESAGDDLKELLFTWADKIILVDETFKDLIPNKYKDKLLVWHVGVDRFFRGFEPDLLDMYKDYIEKEGEFLIDE